MIVSEAPKNFNPLPKDKTKREEELEKRKKDGMRKFKCRFIDLESPHNGYVQYSLKVFPGETIRNKLWSGKIYELTKIEIEHLMTRNFPRYDYKPDPLTGLATHQKVGTKQRFSIEILPESL
jgi:hypothetical protein